MMKGLQKRIALNFFGIAATVLITAVVVIAFEIHYHLDMFKQETLHNNEIASLGSHLERALQESVFYTLIGAVILVFILSHFAAKRMASPLIQMQNIARKWIKGDWHSRVIISGKDEITELGSSLNELASQLSKQDRIRKDMTADIAHELRTPLATLKSHIEAFEDGIWEPTPERLRSCTEEINRLIFLVNDIEQLHTFDAPDFQMNISRVNLYELVNLSLNPIRAAYSQKGITIKVQVPEYITLPVDLDRMRQVFLNLLTNSYKYSPSGGSVTISARENREYILLSIKDNGIGIKQESLNRVFHRFFREDNSRSRETGGSGIGLAVVKRLVNAHQGEVWAESTEGEGTAIFIKLPNKRNQTSS
ncbi:sensor histidine kinase [Peribacillus sp. SCS-155]|uniref:sensor histidine kinase n=1 Tax=Peribacillus sedimenti TaxID=3115297 RepID=UPI0039061129